MKPVIPDYEWITYGERVNKPILLTDHCIEHWGQVKPSGLLGCLPEPVMLEKR